MKYKPCKLRLIFLLGVFQLLGSIEAKATDEKYASLPLRGTSNQIAKDSFNVVQDTVFFNLSLRPTQTTFSVKNFITFKVDEYSNISLPDTFKVTITFKVYFSKLNGALVVSDSSTLQTLYVEYNKFRNYQSKAVYTFSGGYQATAKIFSVTSSSSSGTFATYKNALMVENEIRVTREYEFNPTVNVVQSIAGVLGSLSDADSCSSAGEFMVNWGKVAVADEYDLEWAYIDSSAISNYYIINTTTLDPKKIFLNNATRVSITSESYQIPILYDNGGILFFRVRPVRVKQSGQRLEANWSSNYSSGMGSYGFTGHERNLNWQSSTSYAEEGKRKSVVQYFDGVLKSRQTVTKDNNTCFTIVAETMYDYQGRPVIQVLPAPTLNRLIGYTPHFNRDINGADYDKSIFDADTTGGSNNCNAVLPGMGSMSGASLYYSSSNTLSNTGYNKYIPNANLFPFTETRYAPDNTGRIAMQGGVGKEFQINQTGESPSHESRYYYGSADQEELDALFGTEVGNASHYSKNMVRDANGQYSVSYVDMHGRTIATALAGQYPAKLDTLVSSNNKTIVKRLLDTTNNLISGNSIISNKALIVTRAGFHRLQYSLSPDSISIKDCATVNVYYDCLFDLEVTISNDCGNPGNNPVTITRTNVPAQVDTAWNVISPFSIDTSINLSEGSYLITKKLTISQKSLDQYNELFLRRNTCKTQQQFIDEQRILLLAKIQCYPTCQACTDSLGTWPTFRAKYMLNNNVLPADSANFREQALLAYQAQNDACNDLCNNTGLHNSIRQQMLTDMTAPYGQYAEIDSAFFDFHSIFYTNSGNAGLRFKQIPSGTFYKDEFGRPDSLINNFQQKVPPTDPSVTAQNFIDNFKEGWAETLLPLHPEYCYLLKYDSYAASHIWDERFAKIETYKQAKDSGFLNPSAFVGLPSIFNSPVPSAQDPFFTSLQTDSLPAFKNYLLNYITTSSPAISAWSLATIMAHCDTADINCFNSYKDLNTAFIIDTSCRGEQDFAWRYFREMYLTKKAEIVNQAVFNNCTNPAVLPWHTLSFPNIKVLDGTNGIDINVASGNDSLTNFINDNCKAYVTQWLEEMKPCNLTDSDSTLIPRLIGVCKAGGNIDHIFGASTTKPGTTSNGDTSFIQVLKSVLGSRYDTTCNAYLITAPKPYDKQPAYGEIEVWGKPDSCQCNRITSLYQQYQTSATYEMFSDYVYSITGTHMYPEVLDSLLMLCNGQITCKFLETALVLPPALQCNVANTCADCATVNNVYNQFKTDFPGIIPSKNDVDSVQQNRNSLFEKYMNRHLGFSKNAVEYLNYLDTCSLPVYTPHTDISGCDTTMWRITELGTWSHNPTVRLADYIQNGVFKSPEYDMPNMSTGSIKRGLSYVDTLCLDNYFVYENRVRFPIDSAHLQYYINQGRSATLYGSYFHEFHFDNKVDVTIWINKGKYWHPQQIDSMYAYIIINENGVETVRHALIPTGLKDLSQWHTIKAEFKNGILKTYLNGQLLDQANYTRKFTKFYQLAHDPYGFDLECDWVKMYDSTGNLKFFEDFIGCGNLAKQTLPKCAAACSPLDVLISNYQKQFINPTVGYVDYDMRTFAGNKTLDAGPKGVFDINKNLIGNTIDGTTTQIKQSYVTIWNSSAVNQVIGTLSLLGNGKFRLSLNPTKTAPCDGIIGMRFYQFDAPVDTLDGVRVGDGSYVDFGDGNKEIIVKGLDARGTKIMYYPQVSSQSGIVYSVSDSVVRVPPSMHVTHIFPNTSLKTITVYHPDVEAIFSLDGFVYSPFTALSKLKNLRGYMPQYALDFTFHSTQDITVNTFQNIVNYNQVNTLQTANIFSHNVASPWGQMKNTNFSAFSANNNMRSIAYLPYIGIPSGTYNVQLWPSLFPNIKTNYPYLKQLNLQSFFGEYNSTIDFSIPTLKSLTISGFFDSTKIDSLIIQVSRSTQDSGEIQISDLDAYPSVRTAASNAAYNSLAARHWKLMGGGMNLSNITAANINLPLRDSLPLSSNFTDFYNQQYNTSYSYNQLMTLLKNQYGYTPDLCTVSSKYCNNTGPLLCGDLDGAFPAVNPPDLTPCADSTLFSVGVGTKLYNAYRDSLVNVFNNRYLARCLKARYNESFTIAAPITEFHYTLYYYDQAGNLVKTIPPAGVDVSKFGWATAYSDSIKTYRAAGTLKTPAHVLPTQYRYNTLNQVVAQFTPDAGASKFWYDRLGRLVLSQNATQADKITELNRNYSYTMYDYLGRITEVGQIVNSPGVPVTDIITRNTTTLNAWFAARNTYRHQITKTGYDTLSDISLQNTIINQRNLRNRVSFTSYTELSLSQGSQGFNNRTIYSYDIHGNVDTLIQDYGNSSITALKNIMNIQPYNENRWKRMVYNYDLISGKVNHVAYQPPRGNTYYPDMMYHRYSYDAENRLTLAETSMDSVIWEKDARYEYYRHGPMARTVIGEQLVQGTDYAYTLQGWLKGVNAISLSNGDFDMGSDGKIGAATQYVGRDALGFNLNYFLSDYLPIKNTLQPFPVATPSDYRPLYNGNINSMAVNINFPGATSVQVPQLYNYKYDQLNRITGMEVYRGLNQTGNSWSGMTISTDYKERITYDANGNILKYLRNGTSSPNIQMDNLVYNYDANTNRLNHVKDSVTAANYADDIDNQATDNYAYDKIGNLTKDFNDSITLVKWNVYGKITEIQRSPSTANPVNNIQYTYDAAGNRLSKRVTKSTNSIKEYTWYVRDASGNVMSIYNSTGTSTTMSSINYTLNLTEQHLYGSSRLGILNRNISVKTTFVQPSIINFTRGNKFFELSNHLGNVLVTISDKKKRHDAGTGFVDYYDADIVTANDFYPGGMLMPGRKYAAGASAKYRFSINGQEKETEVNENITTALYWEYDSRIVRRWNVDPVIKPWESPYACLSNNPIIRIDPNGDDDYFDSKGKYLGSDKNGTKVRVIRNPVNQITNLYTKDGSTINKSVGEKNSQALSSVVKGNDIKDLDNKLVLISGVLNHYAKDAEVKGVVKPGIIFDENVPAYTGGESDVSFNILYGSMNGNRDVLDNSKDITNTLYHEKLHQDEFRNNKKIETFADHANIYINQFKHSSFKGMSTDTQIGYIGSAMDFILNEQFSTTEYSSANSTISNNLISKLNSAIKSQGYQVTAGGITSLDLYKGKKLVATIRMTEKKSPN